MGRKRLKKVLIDTLVAKKQRLLFSSGVHMTSHIISYRSYFYGLGG